MLQTLQQLRLLMVLIHLSSINVDWSNSATVGGVTSTISGVSIPNTLLQLLMELKTFLEDL
jgi:hypothetical protein